MDGWGKIAAGVALGVAGTVYATNRKLREKLPDTARDLPDSVKRRFEGAVSAAKEASANRRREILDNLERHSSSHPPPREKAPGPMDPGYPKPGSPKPDMPEEDETSTPSAS